jgi:hypothetical protein
LKIDVFVYALVFFVDGELPMRIDQRSVAQIVRSIDLGIEYAHTIDTLLAAERSAITRGFKECISFESLLVI